MSKKTLKQKQQALADSTSNNEQAKGEKLTKKESKFHAPNRPSI